MSLHWRPHVYSENLTDSIYLFIIKSLSLNSVKFPKETKWGFCVVSQRHCRSYTILKTFKVIKAVAIVEATWWHHHHRHDHEYNQTATQMGLQQSMQLFNYLLMRNVCVFCTGFPLVLHSRQYCIYLVIHLFVSTPIPTPVKTHIFTFREFLVQFVIIYKLWLGSGNWICLSKTVFYCHMPSSKLARHTIFHARRCWKMKQNNNKMCNIFSPLTEEIDVARRASSFAIVIMVHSWESLSFSHAVVGLSIAFVRYALTYKTFAIVTMRHSKFRFVWVAWDGLAFLCNQQFN